MESAAMPDATKELTLTYDVIDPKLSIGEISLKEMKDMDALLSKL